VRLPEFFLFNESTRRVFRELISPVINLLVRKGVSPNAVTTVGLLFSMAAGVVYSTGNIYLGGWLVGFSGTCDIIDGQLARKTGRTTAFGAFYDSCTDRFSDGFILMGLAWFFAGGPPLFWSPVVDHPGRYSPVTVIMILLALTGAYATSYVKARAEAVGIECRVGRMQRAERFVFLLVASAAGALPGIGILLMKLALAFFAVLNNFTAVQRMIHTGRSIIRQEAGTDDTGTDRRETP
jgi:CDP-diacylglycerol--glycerol-3-phosphate 3-phosphatidyltransferase